MQEAERAASALEVAVEWGAPEAWIDLVDWLGDSLTFHYAAEHGGQVRVPDPLLASQAAHNALKLGLVGAPGALARAWWIHGRAEALPEVAAHVASVINEAVQRNPDDAEALYYLGLFTCAGFGVPANPASAVSIQQRAAQMGYAPAMFELFVHYHNGIGVAPDPKAAMFCLEKAAAADHPRGLYSLGALHATGEGVAKDMRRASELYRRASDLGNPLAKVSLASMFATGDGVPQDRERAERYFKEAEACGFDTDGSRDAVGMSAPLGVAGWLILIALLGAVGGLGWLIYNWLF